MNFEISSQSVGQITEALSKAQGKIENALKDSKNPFFKSTYADLSSVMAVTRAPLSENGLSFSSSIVEHEGKPYLIATLSHVSGEWFRSYMPLITAKNDMQSLGAAVSYARRFCLASLCHVGVEEDDGQSTVDKNSGEVKPALISQDQVKTIISMTKEASMDGDAVSKFLSFMGVSKFMDIKASDFERAVKALHKKIEVSS
jgi:hypothetical protein